jgi:hypothetical protein
MVKGLFTSYRIGLFSVGQDYRIVKPTDVLPFRFIRGMLFKQISRRVGSVGAVWLSIQCVGRKRNHFVEITSTILESNMALDAGEKLKPVPLVTRPPHQDSRFGAASM